MTPQVAGGRASLEDCTLASNGGGEQIAAFTCAVKPGVAQCLHGWALCPAWSPKTSQAAATHHIRCRPSPGPNVNIYDMPACKSRWPGPTWRERPNGKRTRTRTHTHTHTHTHAGTHARGHAPARAHAHAHTHKPTHANAPAPAHTQHQTPGTNPPAAGRQPPPAKNTFHTLPTGATSPDVNICNAPCGDRKRLPRRARKTPSWENTYCEHPGPRHSRAEDEREPA